MKLHTLHRHIFAVVIPGHVGPWLLPVVLPWLFPAALSWMCPTCLLSYMLPDIYSCFYTRGKQMIVVTRRHPHRCLAPRDLCRQPSYIHHKSQIIYLHPSIVSRRSSIIVIACHCHLSSSSSVLHIQQQSSIVNHQALAINNQSSSVHIFITHPSYIACRRRHRHYRHYHHTRHHPSSIINIIQNRLSQANWVKPMQSEVRIKIKIKAKQSKATVKQIKAKQIKS